MSNIIKVDYTGGVDLYSGLNDKQIEAVSATEGYYRIIAGAGSGKTRTLTHRFAYLVKELGISPRNILCVTFTNKAANEMRGRIKRLLGDGYDAALITTYHGFCVKVLKEDINRLFYPSNFKILDPSQQKKIIDEIYTEYEIKLDYSSFEKTLEYIYREKTHLKYIPMMIDPAYSFSSNNAVGLEEKIYIKYLEKQKKIYGLDFNDLLYFVIYLFEHNEDILEKWKERLHYIQVDEFQDSSKKELDIINMLCKGNDNLFVVGDPDQNIYEWRSSDNRFLVHFDKNYPNVQTIFLTQNYRSTPEILSVSNSLIEKNQNRVPKDLFTKNPSGRKVEHIHLKNEDEEAQWLASKIKEIVNNKNSKNLYSDIAVLFRSSYVSRFIEQALYKSDIPYIIHGGVRFFDRMEIKDSIAFLKLINDINDDEAFVRIVNVPKRQIGKTRVEALKRVQEELLSQYDIKKSLFEILCDNYGEDIFAGTLAEDFVNTITEFKEKTKEPNAKVSELLNGILERTGYKAYISKSGDMERFDNVTELLASITEFEQQAGEDVSLSSYLQQLSVISDYESERNQNCVKLMTIHSSKGLEFPYVIIAGMTDGVFPSRRTLEDRKIDGLEEERRLCYVAMTRAMRELYMVESEGNTYGESKKLPSRFLYDIDQSYLNTIGAVSEDIIKDLAVKVKQIDSDKGGGNAGEKKLNLNLVKIQPDANTTNGADGYKRGDIVRHKVFGLGEVVDIDMKNDAYMIKFANSEKPKPIGRNYPGILPAGSDEDFSEYNTVRQSATVNENNKKKETEEKLLKELNNQLQGLLVDDTEDNPVQVEPKVNIVPQKPVLPVSNSTDWNKRIEDDIGNFKPASNFNKKLDRFFGKKQKSQREPDPADIVDIPDIINIAEAHKMSEIAEMPEISDDTDLADIFSSDSDIAPAPVITQAFDIDVGKDDGQMSEADEADDVRYGVPISLYDAPPQILYDNADRVNLWNDPNVPKKGWVCVDVIDLGQPVGECGMCGKEDIRYVHIMRHEKHQSIGVGCVCAGNMEGDINAAKERENALKNKISRYGTFFNLDLKISAKGNPYAKYKNTYITFMKKKDDANSWNFVEGGEFSSYYRSLEEAKRAAFEKVDARRG
ncbi:MAG: UvrD-helicase domain-containing protein [Oscillospiraceae bacterium]|nr:UvrD-helicase domain-containing protein [Oscillospiraceae bacterium]